MNKKVGRIQEVRKQKRRVNMQTFHDNSLMIRSNKGVIGNVDR